MRRVRPRQGSGRKLSAERRRLPHEKETHRRWQNAAYRSMIGADETHSLRMLGGASFIANKRNTR